jgi:hypothetical protein
MRTLRSMLGVAGVLHSGSHALLITHTAAPATPPTPCLLTAARS